MSPVLDIQVASVMDQLQETHLAIHDCELDIEDLIVLEKALS